MTGIEKHGAYKGRRFIEVTPNTKNTKTEKLSLKHPTFDSNHLTHRYHEDEDDPFDFVKLFHHYNDHCLPPATSGVELGFGNRFFRRKAPNSVLNMRKKAGIMFTAGLEKNQVVGKNYFKDLMRSIAIDCDLDNPDRQTSSSLRSEHICTLMNAQDALDPKTIMASTRHKTIAAHNVYKRNSQVQLDKRTKAFHEEKKNHLVSLFYLYYHYLHLSSLIIVSSFHYLFNRNEKNTIEPSENVKFEKKNCRPPLPQDYECHQPQMDVQHPLDHPPPPPPPPPAHHPQYHHPMVYQHQHHPIYPAPSHPPPPPAHHPQYHHPMVYQHQHHPIYPAPSQPPHQQPIFITAPPPPAPIYYNHQQHHHQQFHQQHFYSANPPNTSYPGNTQPSLSIASSHNHPNNRGHDHIHHHQNKHHHDQPRRPTIQSSRREKNEENTTLMSSSPMNSFNEYFDEIFDDGDE